MKKFFLLTAFALFAFTAHAEDAAKPFEFTNAVVRETPAKMAAGYLTIKNTTDKADSLVAAQATWADKIALHMVKTSEEGILQMQPVKQIPLLPNSSVSLEQGGYHLMISNIKEELKIGETKDITLRFAKSGTFTVSFTVEPLGKGTQAKIMHEHMIMSGHDMKME